MFAPNNITLTMEEAQAIYASVSGADTARIALKGSFFVNFLDIDKQKLSKILVDKTKLLYEIAKQNNIFFIARPRRFGKSLAVDMLDRLFRAWASSSLAISAVVWPCLITMVTVVPLPLPA